ncbi:hypothetical protein ALC53_04186 [Atta colombica]|uniref:Uncharacterized protein n=1 Tax=Atta colombica TaxID=520822 RepID=A0A195BMH8_9HYME|nr:hypothetical protein ALC53_04186 [Atta colombica]
MADCEKSFTKDDVQVYNNCHLLTHIKLTHIRRRNDTENDQKTCVKLRFIDSYKFFSISLDKLTLYLHKDKLTRSEFFNLNAKNFNLLTVEKLKKTELPSNESFYGSLTSDTVSEDDCAHVVKRFSIQKIDKYSDLYLKTDVLLLTGIFENFRNTIVILGSDPIYTEHYTLSSSTIVVTVSRSNAIHDLTRKCDPTLVNFQLLTDVDIVLFVECDIRGGLSKNEYMQSYDPSKKSTHIMYFDINNLYGWNVKLQFVQSSWFRELYIELNMNFRTSRNVCSENLTAIEMRKFEVKFIRCKLIKLLTQSDTKDLDICIHRMLILQS